MLNDHSGPEYWECMFCDESTKHTSETNLERHISLEHGAAISKEDMSGLLSVSHRTTSPTITRCPLCTVTDSASPLDNNNVLLDHIAEHIHAFALRSLPWPSTTTEESQRSLDASANKVDDWLHRSHPDVQGYDHRPALAVDRMKYAPEGHFVDNEYFAESSGASILTFTGVEGDEMDKSYDSEDEAIEALSASAVEASDAGGSADANSASAIYEYGSGDGYRLSPIDGGSNDLDARNAVDSAGVEIGPSDDVPADSNYDFADKYGDMSEDIVDYEAPPEQQQSMPDLARSLDTSREQSIAFVERQREPKQKGVLRIPGPRDYELGLKPEEISDESQQFDRSRGEVEPGSAASKALVNQHNPDTFFERPRPTTSGRRFGAGGNTAELEDEPTDPSAKPPTTKPSLTRRIFNHLVGKPEPVSKKSNTSKRDKAPIAQQAYQANQFMIDHVGIVDDAPTSAPSNQSSVDIRARRVRSSEGLPYCNDTKTRQEQETANIGGAFPPIDLRRRASYPESLDLIENSEEVCIVTHNLHLLILMLDRVSLH